MDKVEITNKLIKIVNESDNNYDAYDDVSTFLNEFLPKEKITKLITNYVYIAMSAGTMEMKVDGVYDSKEDMIDYYRKAWGIEGDDEEVLNYLQQDGEWSYDKSTYHKSIQVSRDNKLSEIIES